MAEEGHVGTLEEQALQRQAKLKALREKKSEQQSVSELRQIDHIDVSSIYCPPHRVTAKGVHLRFCRNKKQNNLYLSSKKRKLKFRSYNPQTEELKEKKLPKGKPENG